VTVRWDRTKGAPEPLAALDRVELQECGEPLVDIRPAAPAAFIARDTVIPFLRASVAERLEEVARSLQAGLGGDGAYHLGVTEAWRPLARQKRIYEFMLDCAREAYPERGNASLRRTVNRLVHACDRKAPPGHCTGAAVDVNLYSADGELLDVSSPFTRFEASRTYTLGLNAEAQRCREALVEAMLGAGFSNCRDEWWHYSWGDAAWAVRTGERACVYGSVELDESLYAEQERLSEEAFRVRENPFLPSV